MKSKEEIINDNHFKVWYDGNGDTVLYLEHCLESMEVYAQQEKGICKWKLKLDEDEIEFAYTSCGEEEYAGIDYYKYCPHCGKLIERDEKRN